MCFDLWGLLFILMRGSGVRAAAVYGATRVRRHATTPVIHLIYGRETPHTARQTGTRATGVTCTMQFVSSYMTPLLPSPTRADCHCFERVSMSFEALRLTDRERRTQALCKPFLICRRSTRSEGRNTRAPRRA